MAAPRGSVSLIEAPLREIDAGWDFKVVILEGEWVLRMPRSARSVEKIESEVRLLSALGSVLPVEIPSFEQVSREPWFVLYRLIHGEPLHDEDPGGVRAFLDALHGFESDGIQLRRPDWLAIYRAHAEDWQRVVLPLLDVDERRQAEAVLAEIETLTGYVSTLVHCDLGPAHLLCRDGRLVGVIDWGDAKVGDPAVDYAWLLNGPFPDWDVDDDVRRRARIYYRLGPWFEVEYGVRTEQSEWVRSGLAGLRSRL